MFAINFAGYFDILIVGMMAIYSVHGLMIGVDDEVDAIEKKRGYSLLCLDRQIFNSIKVAVILMRGTGSGELSRKLL
jgi:hypothetical protein